MTGEAKAIQDLKILVVDDEPVILAAIRKVLRTEGFQIDEADSVNAARKMLAENSYSSVLTDLMMPGEYGDVLLREALAENPGMPAILVSGYATVENALGSIRNGAFDFLPKPFSFEELGALAIRLKRFLALPLDTRLSALKPKPSKSPEKEAVFCLGGHSWVRIHENGTASAGAGKIPRLTSGKVVLARLPRAGEAVEIGHHFAHFIDSDGYEHPLLAPLSGRVLEVEQSVPQEPGAEGDSDFESSRLITLLPSNLDGELGLLTRCIEGGLTPE